MGSTRKNAQARTLWALTLALVLALLAAVLLAATAPAAAAETGRTLAKPGKPTVKTPKGAIATTKPAFTWGKAARATSYELRVYQGAKLVLKKTGLRKRSWTCTKALPQDATLSWKVRGKNARGSGPWSRSLKFKVATPPPPPPPPSSAKAITAFSFAVPAATGVITEATHTIALTVPHGTNVSALVATFTTTGASVKVGGALQTSGLTANDFTGPVTYTVTAADGTTQDYVVTVTVAVSPATQYLVTSSDYSPVAGSIVTISAQLADAHGDPVATPGTRNVVTWTKSDAGGSMAGASSTDANGVATVLFTTASAPGTATTVTATTGAVTGTSATITTTLAIGDSYQGGKVACILQPGDPGYVPGETRGLIAAKEDQSAGIRWDNGSFVATGATATAWGTGSGNTTRIITVQGATATSYAAGLARAYDGGGYSDWSLPSKDELNKLYLSKDAIGGFVGGSYWCSSEINADFAWVQGIGDGVQFHNQKNDDYAVRAVRSFPADSAKAITAFTTPTSTNTSISETLRTIAVLVPLGTDVSALVPTFTTTGAVVSVGAKPQESGATANDFTSPVTYRVTAADASTQDYTVTVAVGASIGQAYAGGKIAYILQLGDPGYFAGQTHGLIAATADQSAGIVWSNITATEIGAAAQGTMLGTGQSNTTAIVSQDDCTGGAAYLCCHLELGGYDDWYLPSKDELAKLYLSRVAVGGYGYDWMDIYWSSSEYDASNAWYHSFTFDDQAQASKGSVVIPGRVRPIRSF